MRLDVRSLLALLRDLVGGVVRRARSGDQLS